MACVPLGTSVAGGATRVPRGAKADRHGTAGRGGTLDTTTASVHRARFINTSRSGQVGRTTGNFFRLRRLRPGTGRQQGTSDWKPPTSRFFRDATPGAGELAGAPRRRILFQCWCRKWHSRPKVRKTIAGRSLATAIRPALFAAANTGRIPVPMGRPACLLELVGPPVVARPPVPVRVAGALSAGELLAGGSRKKRDPFFR